MDRPRSNVEEGVSAPSAADVPVEGTDEEMLETDRQLAEDCRRKLQERQIEEYERIMAGKIYFRFDRDEWDFSPTTHGFFRFGAETVLGTFAVTATVYLVLIFFTCCRPPHFSDSALHDNVEAALAAGGNHEPGDAGPAAPAPELSGPHSSAGRVR